MKKEKKYVTTVSTDGDVYVDIADVMTIMGYPMNHCTARNIVLSVMERLVTRISKNRGVNLSHEKTREIASSPEFQTVMMNCLDKINHITRQE